jgi:hypothetical protein
MAPDRKTEGGHPMTFKAIVSETAKHKVTLLVEAEDLAEASKKAKAGDGDVIHDEVDEWMNDPELLSCHKRVDASSKVFVYEEGCNNSYTLTWKDGHSEKCIRSEYPMHITLVKGLLLEAGYREVSLADFGE